MAKVRVVGDQLVFRMNWLEKIAVLSFQQPTAPVAAVRVVDVESRPAAFIRSHSLFGASQGAWPLFFTSVRASYKDGRAAVLVYWRRPAVRVEFGPTAGRWRLFLASCPDPNTVAAQLRRDLAAAGPNVP